MWKDICSICNRQMAYIWDVIKTKFYESVKNIKRTKYDLEEICFLSGAVVYKSSLSGMQVKLKIPLGTC